MSLSMRHGLLLLPIVWRLSQSQTFAEKAALEFAKENQIDLVTLLPVYVICPVLPPILSRSVQLVLNQINGKSVDTNPSILHWCCHNHSVQKGSSDFSSSHFPFNCRISNVSQYSS
ncbi:hypothetical protein PanWU01x14_051300 [Parasponia andersonii]|uniref:Uncharacterized protein n=1 Tax=Parasponia andersonii TaxID=3476 RepID=A0A2P5DLZ4_PARAD|nr:hypothetical protein PanWU01x14_051300 [Parasponia andersonii]